MSGIFPSKTEPSLKKFKGFLLIFYDVCHTNPCMWLWFVTCISLSLLNGGKRPDLSRVVLVSVV